MAGRLWHQSDFLKLWAGESISALGSAVTNLALPLVAIITLNMSAREMGILRALENLPVLLFGLFVGVWLDRVRRRPVMIAAQFGRAILLALIPLAGLLGLLRVEHLYLVGFLVGTLAVIFGLAVTSYLPTVVEREKLVEGNARLQASRSIAAISGDSLAGLLVQSITAPLAIALDALSFFVSTLCLLFIRAPEAPPPRAQKELPIWSEIYAGLRLVFRDPILSSMIMGTTIASLGASLQSTVFILYLTRELAINPVWLGLILASASTAALLGAMLAAPIARRYGPGPVLIGAVFVESIGMMVLPLAGYTAAWVTPLLILGQILISTGLSIYSINQISLRQAITPDHLLGRVNASRRVLVFGVAPIGALIGGILGEIIGLQAVLALGAAIMVFSFIFHLASPLRGLQTQPTPQPRFG